MLSEINIQEKELAVTVALVNEIQSESCVKHTNFPPLYKCLLFDSTQRDGIKFYNIKYSTWINLETWIFFFSTSIN